MESMSGETYRPHHSRSSPVLTTRVISSGAMTWRRPSTNFAPPVPPLRTQIMRASLFPFLGLFLLLLLPGPDHRRRRGVFLTRDPAGRLRQEEILGRRANAGARKILSPPCAGAVAPDAARAFPD